MLRPFSDVFNFDLWVEAPRAHSCGVRVSVRRGTDSDVHAGGQRNEASRQPETTSTAAQEAVPLHPGSGDGHRFAVCLCVVIL